MDAVVIIVVAVSAGLVLTGFGFVAAGRGLSRRRARRRAALARARGKPDLAAIVQSAKDIHAKAKEFAPVVKDSVQSIVSWAHSFNPKHSDLAPDGTITVVFSDIENSTAINARLGDQRWVEELRAHAKVVGDLASEHNGDVVKSQGDGFMLVFKDPRDAVRFAAVLQRTLASAPEPGREPLRVRIGVHTGSAISEKGDYFGENVAFAARVGQAAKGGEILVSSAVRDRVEEDPDVQLSPPKSVDLKGIDGSQKLFAIEW